MSHSGVIVREMYMSVRKMSHSGVTVREMYMNVKEMSQRKNGCENIVHGCERNESKEEWS